MGRRIGVWEGRSWDGKGCKDRGWDEEFGKEEGRGWKVLEVVCSSIIFYWRFCTIYISGLDILGVSHKRTFFNIRLPRIRIGEEK